MAYGEMRDDGFLFCAPMYGPNGFTDGIWELTAPWSPGELEGGRVEFAGLPVAIAEGVVERCRGAGGTIDAKLVEVGAQVGGALCGALIDSSRNDERVEFSELQIDVSGCSDVERERVVAELADAGLQVRHEVMGRTQRVTAVNPRRDVSSADLH